MLVSSFSRLGLAEGEGPAANVLCFFATESKSLQVSKQRRWCDCVQTRRLQTVMERVLDEISFAASDRSGETVKIDADYVNKHIGDLAKNADLSWFIL